MEENKKVIDMFPDNKRIEDLKRKAKVIKDIAVDRSLAQLEDPRTLTIAGAAGLWQGLKYKGDLKLGFKAGLSTAGVMIGINVVNGLVQNVDKIKNT